MSNKLKENNEKLVLTHSKKMLPLFFIWLCAFAYIFIAVLGILFIINIIKYHNINYIYPIIVGITVAILLITNYTFSWFDTQTFTDVNGKLNITVIDKLSHKKSIAGETRYKIYNITEIKKKHNDLIVYGDIEKIETHRKFTPKKMTIYEGALSQECIELLENYKVKG